MQLTTRTHREPLQSATRAHRLFSRSPSEASSLRERLAGPISGILLALILAGCAVGPDYEGPEIEFTPEFSPLAAQADVLNDGQDVEGAWWQSFEDPMLTELVDRALARNSDLRAAVARVEQSLAQRRAAAAGLYPQLNLGSSAGRSRQSEVGTLPPGAPVEHSVYELGGSASWELDLFGRVRRATEAADAQLEAVFEDRRGVLIAVVGEVAASYVELRSIQRQIGIAESNRRTAERTLELTRLLFDQQLAQELDLRRARADVQELQASEDELRGAERQAAARLAFLIGEPAGTSMDALLTPTDHELVVPVIPTGLASELLTRRPDVRAAERRLAAASAKIGVAEAARFPSFSLTGALSTLATSVDGLFSSASEAWSYAGVVNWPLFDGGRMTAEIDAANARYREAAAAYEGTVLRALADAEDAFARYVYAVKQTESLDRALEDRQRSLDLARLRYQAEIDSLFPVLDAQRRLLSLQSRRAAAQRDELIAAVGVFRALGGGWASTGQLVARELSAPVAAPTSRGR